MRQNKQLSVGIIILIYHILLIEFVIIQKTYAVSIAEINIQGSKTNPETILKLLDSKAGDEFNEEILNEDIQRIMNTGLFYDIKSLISEKNGQKRIDLSLKNKFSTIPIFKYKRGGGTSLLTIGVYEVNLFNKLLEGGIQYERMKGRDGLVTWFRHPYFISNKNLLGTEIYIHTVNLPLLTIEGEEEAYFDDKKVRWNLHIEREIWKNVRPGIQLSIYKNEFKEDNSTNEKMQRNNDFTADNPLKNGLTVSLSPKVIFGKINVQKFYVYGTELILQGEFSNKELGSDFNFTKGLLVLGSAFRPVKKINIATNFEMGSKTGSEFQHKFYMGGFDSIRGFFDGQFRGEHMWLANIEVRPTLIEKPQWVLQGNVFADYSKTWDAVSFGTDGFHNPFSSYGIGARIILPKVYRAVLRMDFAKTVTPVSGYGFSFGLQQFF